MFIAKFLSSSLKLNLLEIKLSIFETSSSLTLPSALAILAKHANRAVKKLLDDLNYLDFF